MMKRFLLIFWLLVCVSGLGAEFAFPSTNVIDWNQYCGVEGGIPLRSTVFTNLASGTSLASVQSWLDACPSNQVVTLDTGTYNWTGDLILPSYTTLRGSGTGTLVNLTGSIRYSSDDIGYSRVYVDIYSGADKGSSNVSLVSAPSLTVGNVASISELNNSNISVWPFGYEEDITAPTSFEIGDEPRGGISHRGQMVEVKSITDGTNITFWPPLSSDFTDTPDFEFATEVGGFPVTRYSGLEDMRIDQQSAARMMETYGGVSCWVSNVWFDIHHTSQEAIYGYWTFRQQVEHCSFEGTSTLGFAIYAHIHTHNWLVVNNWFHYCAQSFITAGRSSASAFLYNYTGASTNTSTAIIAEHTFHGAHPQWYLFEGNKGIKLHVDQIHGSSSSHTIFRNWWKAEMEGYTTSGEGAISVDSWNWYLNIVGNILGQSSTTTGNGWSYEESSQDDNSGKSLLAWGYSGYNDWEPDNSKSRTLLHNNYDFVNLGIVDNISGQSTNLPTSVFYSSKPEWFGNLAWPPIGPDTTGLYTNMLPAEYRFVYGTDPPAESGGGGPTSAPTRPRSVSVIISP